MNKLLSAIIFTAMCCGCTGSGVESLIEKTHTAKNVGVSLYDGKKYYLIITDSNDLFITSSDDVLGQNFEFIVSSVEPLSDDNPLLGRLGVADYNNAKYLVNGIEAKSISIQVNGKCYRSNKEVIEMVPCGNDDF